jgi:hypothetical protein
MRKLPVTGTLTQVTACADSLYNRRLYLASTSRCRQVSRIPFEPTTGAGLMRTG